MVDQPPPLTPGVGGAVGVGERGDEGTLVVEQHFAIVPEWIIAADISAAAYRLFSDLLRPGP